MNDLSQPPLLGGDGGELTVAIAGLALGGAERIVLDWAVRTHPAWKVHLVVLRDHAHEWPVPPFVKVTRLRGRSVRPALARLGRHIARSAAPVCVCHLLTASERDALGASGAFIVPVVHNAEAGWLENPSGLSGARHVIAVSEACAADLRRNGFEEPLSVIRHIPQRRQLAHDARMRWRRAWRIPEAATVIGMIGAVKPQKDYPFAVRILRTLLEQRDVYLLILGGPIGGHGREAWHAVLDETRRSGVRHRLAMPGFVPDAAACLPAFDLLLNTSHYEGLSIATLEALVHGIPVVASQVGGQGELAADALTLVPKDATCAVWADAVQRRLERPAQPPAWTGFPSYRLWTLAHLARPYARTDRVLFVTANLNLGGAQRSLVNLAKALRKTKVRYEIAVTGESTAEYFFRELRAAGIPVHRTAASCDAFDHAEVLVQKICADRIGTVCFWNVDPKIKMLLEKAIGFTDVRLVDVSPGQNSFDEMRRAGREFGALVGVSEDEIYGRLDRVVLKYHGAAPSRCEGKVTVIPNGVEAPARAKTAYELRGNPRVVVNGRIAPTKFILEIVQAMALVRRIIPAAELHVFGAAEPRHRDYDDSVRRATGDAAGTTVFFRGAAGDTVARLPEFDAFVVLGKDQGCPNALLEALAAGLPCIANDDGGTGEQLVPGRTGWLVQDLAPATIAAAILRILRDRALAARLGQAGRSHVLASFAMKDMAGRYEQLFASLAPQRLGVWERLVNLLPIRVWRTRIEKELAA